MDFDVEPASDDTPQLVVKLGESSPALQIVVDWRERTVRLELDMIECVQFDESVRIELDGKRGSLDRGRKYYDRCDRPGATFDLPYVNRGSSFVITDDVTTWTIDVGLFAYSFYFDWDSTYRAGDTVSISVPTLDEVQIPTIRVRNATLDFTINNFDIRRVERSAYFEMPATGIDEEAQATMTVSGSITPNIVGCTVPGGCTAKAYTQAVSHPITLLP